MKRYLLISCKFPHLVSFWFLFVFCLFILDVKITRAQEDDSNVDKELVPSESDDTSAWMPAMPPPEEFDWIQLGSGEWLKGEFIALYDEEVEFDSDELDVLKFDWEDVKQVHGTQIFVLRLTGPITVVGLLQVIEDKVYVSTGIKTQEFERNQVITIVPGGQEKEINYWSFKISLGLNVSKGNTDQLQYNSKWNALRRTSATRFLIDYLGNYTTSEGERTVDNQRLNSDFDILMTRKYYIRLVFAQFYRDPFQNIERRVTAGTAIGYNIIDSSRTNWEITGGPAYKYTEYVSVEPGEDAGVSTPALAIGTDFEFELTKRLDFIAGYSFTLSNDESGRYVHHMVTTLEAEITDLLDFDISFIWDYTQIPTARADGSIPEKDDYQLIFWVGLDF